MSTSQTFDPTQDELWLGARASADHVTFRVWTASNRKCKVRVFAETGGSFTDHEMLERADGLYEATVYAARKDVRYRFVIDGTEMNDPWARSYPQGIAQPAQVYQSQYVWQNSPVAKPLHRHVIYELHVGTFTKEGTFVGAARRLPALAALGITAIQLLPLNTYGGEHGWGYDGVAHFAPHYAYGSPDELAAFIDAAHGLNIAVFVDVVYNHFGPAGNALPAYESSYFTRHATGWGDAPNFRNVWMRRYVLANVKMWVCDFHVDGLRFDAVHAIGDDSSPHILREIADMVHGLSHRVLLIAEDDRNDPAIVEKQKFDAIWADDFHHAMHTVLTEEKDGYYAAYDGSVASLAQTIERGWLFEGQTFSCSQKRRGASADSLPASAFIYCLQNHDQIGNRALGDRLNANISVEAYCAASTVLLFLPMTPLLFMGQEWAASTPFCYFTDHDAELGAKVSAGRREEFSKFTAFAHPDARQWIPDPQAIATFRNSKLNWHERSQPVHRQVLQLYVDLLALRHSDPVLTAADRQHLRVRAERNLLVVTRWNDDDERWLLANLGPTDMSLDGLLRPTDRILPVGRFPHDIANLIQNGLPGWSFVILARKAGGGLLDVHSVKEKNSYE